ncbi:PREDICTED: 2,3-bisphosphoglycerate-independent phosphoglycerate mutase-like isoform X2 [Priapulus caudatus]|nr:PREDICTED: 2,3-bisphosphoglycerate-independent phosphoglycerate mutase-like isoform X2 [Priapulus caudatus]
MDKIMAPGKHCELEASGLFVGLPRGKGSNSTVGHLNIGVGRICWQDTLRVNLAVEDRTLSNNPALVKTFDVAKKHSGRVHFLGLVSDGGVHSHINHLLVLLDSARLHGIRDSFIHMFSDGIDSAPTSGAGFAEVLANHIKETKYGQLASVTGRYYAMDRDKQWDRTKIAYEALVEGKESDECSVDRLATMMEQKYSLVAEKKQLDEFIQPIMLTKDGLIRDGDTLVFFNHRGDRMEQLVECFAYKGPFEYNCKPTNLNICTMTSYKSSWHFPVMFPPVNYKNVLAEVISNHGLAQFRCAESVKTASVTTWFNGGVEHAFPMEDRLVVPSTKLPMVGSPTVPSYDLKPAMSGMEIAVEMEEAVASGNYSFLMCNLCAPDIVAHTGAFNATVEAVAETDKAIGVIMRACEMHGYTMMVVGTYGNAESMAPGRLTADISHTCNKVPFVMTGTNRTFRTIPRDATQCDIAPTILNLMGLQAPLEMDGVSLLARL